jgi:uncharacterized metal-binding protein
MPSGRTHDRITLWSLVPIGGLTYLFVREGRLTLIVIGAFLFSGLMFGPDLDIYSVQYKRWGIFRWIWLPYRSLIGHRSTFSHGLIIGTILRIIYLLACCLAIAFPAIGIAQLIWGFDWNWQTAIGNVIQRVNRQEAIAFVVGLELGAMSHSLSDWLGSAYKRNVKRRSRHRSQRRTK